MEAIPKAPSLEEMEVFDACLTLGRGMSGRHKTWIAPDTIIEHLDRYSIKEALAHDIQKLFGSSLQD